MTIAFDPQDPRSVLAWTSPPAAPGPTLRALSGTALADGYEPTLRTLGRAGGVLGDLSAHAQSGFNNPVNPRRLVSLIDETKWTSLGADVKAAACEGLLEKAASEGKKGAGRFFTLRLPVQSVVRRVKPDPRRAPARA